MTLSPGHTNHQSVDSCTGATARTEALSDGVLAIAMAVLVLDLARTVVFVGEKGTRWFKGDLVLLWFFRVMWYAQACRA